MFSFYFIVENQIHYPVQSILHNITCPKFRNSVLDVSEISAFVVTMFIIYME